MTRERLLHDGLERQYVLVEPEGPVERTLLFFHGSLQSGNVIRRFTAGTFDGLPGTRVIYPSGVHNHFNDGRARLPEKTREMGVDDVGFTRELVGRYGGPVFACGYSNGGHMVMRLLIDAPGLLRGACLFAATMPTRDNLATTNPLDVYEPTPVMFLHGTGDRIAPISGGEAALSAAKSRGSVLSARESAEWFAQANGCATGAVSRPYADVERVRWEGAQPVELWSVDGMGHVIPSGNEVSPRLGANTASFVAADAVRGFFGF